jgi:hypothetical protein
MVLVGTVYPNHNLFRHDYGFGKIGVLRSKRGNGQTPQHGKKNAPADGNPGEL